MYVSSSLWGTVIHEPYHTTREKSTHAALVVRDHYILTRFDKEIFTLSIYNVDEVNASFI